MMRHAESTTALCVNTSRFTGKERDTESGLDYFGARYYGSNMGRMMSPDWSAKAEPVPYAKIENPQSLNLYAYVLNNPLRFVDADGHEIDLDNAKKADRDATAQRLTSNTSKAEQKLFTTTTDKNGKTTLNLTAAAKSFKGEHTVAYNRLAAAIGSKNVGSVGIHDTYTVNGKTMNTPVPGVTLGPPPGQAGNFRTMLSSNGFGAGDMSVIPGTAVAAPMRIIAAHEVMGHGLEILTGGDPREPHVWQIENQMRNEQHLDPRPPE